MCSKLREDYIVKGLVYCRVHETVVVVVAPVLSVLTMLVLAGGVRGTVMSR